MCVIITCYSWALRLRVLLEVGKRQPPVRSGFLFTGIGSQSLAVSPGMWGARGGTSVGTVPVSLPLQALAFLNVI